MRTAFYHTTALRPAKGDIQEERSITLASSRMRAYGGVQVVHITCNPLLHDELQI
jgi:hypothetical protein